MQVLGSGKMDAPNPEEVSREKLGHLSANSVDGLRLIINKRSSSGKLLANLCLLSLLSLFMPADNDLQTQCHFVKSLISTITNFGCSRLIAQIQLPNDTNAWVLAFLLNDPEQGNEKLMLCSGNKLVDISGSLYSSGFVSIQDIYLDKSGNVYCTAFDTTDERHNWEIVKIEPNGKATAVTNTEKYDEKSPSVSDDQSQLAYIVGGVICVEANGGKIWLIPHRGRTYLEVTWSPENRLLVTVEEGRRSYIAEIDLANRHYIYRLTNSASNVNIRNPVVSPDGKNLIYVCDTGGNPEIIIADRHGNNSRLLFFGDYPSYSDSTTIVMCRYSNSRPNLFFIDELDIILEAIFPTVENYAHCYIRSVASYTPYTIPPDIPKEAGSKESTENKEEQSGERPNISNKFQRLRNYPDPFNPATAIRYELLVGCNVRLEILNLRGRLIRKLVDGWKAPGNYATWFDAAGLSSGVYLYRLVAGDFQQTRKMVLLK